MNRPVADPAMRALARLLVRFFFKHRQIDGADHLGEGPVLLVANHVNGLGDGLLLIAELPRYPRSLAKHMLWKILPLRPLLRLAGVVPVYRANDGENTAANQASFAGRSCGPCGPSSAGPSVAGPSVGRRSPWPSSSWPRSAGTSRFATPNACAASGARGTGFASYGRRASGSTRCAATARQLSTKYGRSSRRPPRPSARKRLYQCGEPEADRAGRIHIRGWVHRERSDPGFDESTDPVHRRRQVDTAARPSLER